MFSLVLDFGHCVNTKNDNNVMIILLFGVQQVTETRKLVGAIRR